MNWNSLAAKSLEGEALTREECEAVLRATPDQTASLVAAAYQVRRHYFGNRIRLNYLLNAKSGLCPEDCNYCSQSKVSTAPIDKYPWMSVRETLEMADRAVGVHAGRFCMVASGRGPTDGELEQVVESVKAVRQKYPHLEICCCLGLLSNGQAEKLKNAGVYAVNHNLNTSERYYNEICDTHTYADRMDTVQKVKQAGLSPCSGALIGMGETESDIIDLAFSLRDVGVESLPVNFLMPIEGTPLAGRYHLNPTRCLNILCLFRFLNPRASVRISGGREVHLRSLQPLGLYVANSIFIGDYLTTKGQPAEADLAMIHDLGFEIEGDTQAADAPQAFPMVELKNTPLPSQDRVAVGREKEPSPLTLPRDGGGSQA
jgi:biotin synthase